MKRALLATVPILAIASTGCLAQTGFGRARTLPPGEGEISAAIEPQFLTPKRPQGSEFAIPWVQLAFGYHRGVTEDVELGARVWGLGFPGFQTFGGAIDTKLQLTRSEHRAQGVDVAIGTSLAYHQVRLGGTPWHTFAITIPLLIGVNVGVKDQLVFGPRIADYLWTGEGENTMNLIWGGASLGYAWSVSRTITLMPEVVMMYTPLRFNGESSDKDHRGLVSTQVGLGGTFSL